MGDCLVLCGPAGSGKTTRLLAEYRRCAATHGDDGVALIVSTGTAAARAMDALASAEPRHGLFDPRIFTFPTLAETLLDANHRPVRRVSRAQRQLLLTHAVRTLAQAGELSYLAQVADLAGFAGAVGEVIEELKRAAVDPPTFAAIARAQLSTHPANDDLTAIYALYQSILLDRGLYDDTGAFWEARDLLREGKLRPLDQTRVLLIDGFTEFTTTQLEMLQLLSGHVEQILVSLCIGPDRQDGLFSRSRQTLDQLMTSLPGAAQQWLTAPAPTSAVRALGDRVFAQSTAATLPDDGSLRLIGAPGVRGEVRLIGRRVKELLLQGTPPGRIGVLVRSLDGYEVAIAQVFSEFGIPVEISRGQSLSRCPAVQAVLDALDIVSGDWRRDDVVKLVNSNYVDLGRRGDVDGFEALALQARIIGGRQNWLPQLEVLSQRLHRRLERAAEAAAEDEDQEPTQSPAQLQHTIGALEGAKALFTRLTEMLDPLAAAENLTQGIAALSRAVAELGILERAGMGGLSVAGTARDLAGLQELCELLREAGEAPAVLGIADDLGPAGLSGYIRDLCTRERLAARRGTGTAVQVMEVLEARELGFDEVFIAGLCEGSFPRGRRQDPFYHDEHRRHLNATRPVLSERLPQQAHESFLFYVALTRAAQRVTLSYPTSDAAGSPILRSYYVDEVLAQYADPPQLQAVALSQTTPEPQEACAPRELLEATAAAHRRGSPDPAALGVARRVAGQLLGHIGHGVRVARARDSFAPPDHYDGVISTPTALALLRARFGPEHHFSAGQFGEYGHCPLSFFFGRVLRLEPSEEPSEEISHLDLGSIFHHILRDFYKERLARDGGRPLSAGELDEETLRLIDLTAEEFRRWRRSLGISVHRKLWQLTAADVRDDLQALLQFEVAEGEKNPRAVWGCEIPYGTEGEFDVGEGHEPVLVEGRIDRLDILPGTAPLAFVVIDYKTGAGKSRREVLHGRDFQLPLYCLAAAELAFDDTEVRPAWWGYQRVRRPIKLDGRAYAEDKNEQVSLETLMEVALDYMRQYAGQIRGGHFPLPVERCRATYCPFKAICRYDAQRVARRTAGEGAK